MPHRRVFMHSTILGEMNYEFTLVGSYSKEFV